MSLRSRRALLVVAAMLTLCLLASLGIRWRILSSTRDVRHSLADAPRELGTALILGARIWGDRPSHMIEDRLVAGLELYASGRCAQLLVSGAPDEVEVMRAWLVARGVPDAAILVDGAGLRTLDSVVRAERGLDAGPIVVVTQDFHLARAVYLGRQAGLEVAGVAAPARYDYPAALVWRNEGREFLAQVKAWLDVHVLATGAADPDAPIVAASERGANGPC